MPTFNPKVSIVIPVYNGSNYLKEAIDSALAQTYKNIEIIVINDGSTDNGATEKIAKSYGDKIRYFAKENGGVATALNLGIEKMTGEYFSWLSHDDMYEKQKISDQVVQLKQLQDKNTVIACNAKTLFPSGLKKNDYIDKDTFESIDIFLATSAVVGVNGCALLIPKKAFDECGKFDLNLPVTQDYDLWFRIAKKFKFSLLEKNLVISRRHDGQDSVQKQKLCFVAGEKLHYEFLREISQGRFNEFFKANPTNSLKFFENYKVYKNGGYKRTASLMLKSLLAFYQENQNQEYENLFKSEIGQIVRLDIASNQKKKERILFYSNVWHRGGIERVLATLLDNYSSKYECILVVDDDEINQNLGYPLSDLVSLVKINNKRQIDELLSLAIFLEIDIFVGNPNHSEAFIDIYDYLKSASIKTVAYNHGHYLLPYMYGPALYPLALKIKDALKYADSVIWLSRTACSLYNIENQNGIYIPNPVALRTKIKQKNTVGRKILAVARFDDEIKRIDKILLIFKQLHQIDNSYSLDIVGKCPLDSKIYWLNNKTLNEFIEEQDIPKSNLKFWGEQKELSRFYESADFLLLTSRSEGFALVLVEAMASGVPCAALEYIGIEEIIQEGYNGVLAEQDNYSDLAFKINDVLKNESRFFELSRNAQSSVKMFDTKLYYRKWDLLIDVLLKNKNLPQELKLENQLANDDYIKVIPEYERLIRAAISNYLSKETTIVVNRSVNTSSRVRSLAYRAKKSMQDDGLAMTIERVARKFHGKVFKRNK